MYILSGASIHIIAVSFLVFIFVNFFENLIHYSIGKYSNQDTKLELPTEKDFIKMVAVMCVFAVIQGLLTSYFNQFAKV
jgi:hypothetical protein